MDKCYNTKITVEQIEILSFTYTAGDIMCNGKNIHLEKWKTVQTFWPYFMEYLESFENKIKHIQKKCSGTIYILTENLIKPQCWHLNMSHKLHLGGSVALNWQIDYLVIGA